VTGKLFLGEDEFFSISEEKNFIVPFEYMFYEKNRKGGLATFCPYKTGKTGQARIGSCWCTAPENCGHCINHEEDEKIVYCNYKYKTKG